MKEEVRVFLTFPVTVVEPGKYRLSYCISQQEKPIEVLYLLLKRTYSPPLYLIPAIKRTDLGKKGSW